MNYTALDGRTITEGDREAHFATLDFIEAAYNKALAQHAFGCIVCTKLREIEEEPMRRAKAVGQLTIGQAVAALRALPELPVRGVSYYVNSYRGYYEDLAIMPSGLKPGASAPQLADALQSAIGHHFEGWKGGRYYMDSDTLLWLSERGDNSGLRVVGFKAHADHIEILTDGSDP